MTSTPEGPHADSEQLALLALGAPTEPGLAEHVAACPGCAKDLSLLTSLLAADGPDDGVPDGAESAPDEDAPPVPAAALAAQADGNDARALPPQEPAARAAGPAAAGLNADSGGGASHRWVVVAAAIAVFAALVLLAFLLMR